MTGMKEGAGENPFDEADEPAETRSTDRSDTDETLASGETDSHQQRSMQIPYKFRRDGVQEGRDRVPLFLQAETKRGERDALRELEEQFDENVSLTDLREALVKTGLQHLDEVEVHLEEWGYGMTFNE